MLEVFLAKYMPGIAEIFKISVDFLSDVHSHLNGVGIPVQMISLPWFMCLYLSLPLEVDILLIS
jgi:hypothetical protein